MSHSRAEGYACTDFGTEELKGLTWGTHAYKLNSIRRGTGKLSDSDLIAHYILQLCLHPIGCFLGFSAAESTIVNSDNVLRDYRVQGHQTGQASAPPHLSKQPNLHSPIPIRSSNSRSQGPW